MKAITSAWTCTAQPESRQPPTVVRSSCRPPRLSSSGTDRRTVHLKDLGWHRLKDIPEPEHIVQLVADGLEQDFPPLKSLGTPTNLPRVLTPILGRDRELAEIAAQLTSADVRLVTLTGPGGTGKTRLAIAVAHLLAGSRADGVYFVALAMATTADVMWSTIAESLGVPGDSRAPATLFEHIRSRDMFLILDNLEQLAEAAPGRERAPHAGAAPCNIGDLSSAVASDR